jgi:hypothetical protein
MDKKKYNKAFKMANDGESKMFAGCGDLAIMFQYHFGREISVMNSGEGGFVIVCDAFTEGEAPENIPIEEAFKLIKKNPKAYL